MTQPTQPIAKTSKFAWVTRKRAIAILLFALMLIADGYGALTAKAPTIREPVTEQIVVDYWTNATNGMPVVKFVTLESYSAEGAISVNNLITVHVVIYASNRTDWFQYYPFIGFTDAFNPDVSSSKSDIAPYSKIPIVQNKTGWYVADGNLIWLHEGPSWLYFLPQGNLIVSYPDVEKGMYSIFISSVTDTQSFQNNVETHLLTWIAIGFSILLLQPIFEAFLKDVPLPKTQEPRQGTWSIYHKLRKMRLRESQEAPSPHTENPTPYHA